MSVNGSIVVADMFEFKAPRPRLLSNPRVALNQTPLTEDVQCCLPDSACLRAAAAMCVLCSFLFGSVGCMWFCILQHLVMAALTSALPPAPAALPSRSRVVFSASLISPYVGATFVFVLTFL